ncbi:MAG: hypothetical protein K6E56_02530 [Lachnospiraceae bacterium]|nr:hypothetical protein [Lachnospiraceae bacterium]
MKVLLYIADNKLVLLRKNTRNKKAGVYETFTREVPSNCISGGEITNESLFMDHLRSLIKDSRFKVKKIDLAFGTKSSESIKIPVPDRNNRTVLEFVQREFRKYRDFERACVYLPLYKEKKRKTVQVLAGCVSSEALECYLRVFKKLRIKVVSAKLAIPSAVKYISKIQRLKKLDFAVVQFIEDDNIYNILLKKGLYYHLSTHKLEITYEPEKFGEESAQSISILLQFMKANNYPVDNLPVFTSGYLDEYQRACAARNHIINPGVLIDSLDIRKDFVVTEVANTYLFGVLSLLNNDSSQNLLTDYKRLKRGNAKRMSLDTIAIIALSAVLIAFTGIFRTLAYVDRVEVNTQIAEAASMERKAAQYDAFFGGTVELENKLNGVLAVKENLNSYPRGNVKAKKALEKIAGKKATVEITGYNADSGVFTSTAYSKNETDVNEFVEALLESDLIDNVSYSGYSYYESNNC